jgi:hypothetical protein
MYQLSMQFFEAFSGHVVVGGGERSIDGVDICQGFVCWETDRALLPCGAVEEETQQGLGQLVQTIASQKFFDGDTVPAVGVASDCWAGENGVDCM